MRATDLSAISSTATPTRAWLSDPTPAEDGWGELDVDTLRPAPQRTELPPSARRRGWNGRVSLRPVRVPSGWRRRLSDARWSVMTWLAAPTRAAAPPPPRVDRPLVTFS